MGMLLLLLLLLSRFSRVWLCVTPQTAAHQAPPSLGFSRQEHWSGLPFPSPMHERGKWKWGCSVVSDSSRPHGLQPTRLLRQWDFPGKSTGVCCHLLLCLFTLIYLKECKSQGQGLGLSLPQIMFSLHFLLSSWNHQLDNLKKNFFFQLIVSTAFMSCFHYRFLRPGFTAQGKKKEWCS